MILEEFTRAAALVFGVLASLVQFSIWFYVVKQVLKDEADREDMILLIPGSWVLVIAWYVAAGIPAALRRKPRT